jgi:hypothetical protein
LVFSYSADAKRLSCRRVQLEGLKGFVEPASSSAQCHWKKCCEFECYLGGSGGQTWSSHKTFAYCDAQKLSPGINDTIFGKVGQRAQLVVRGLQLHRTACKTGRTLWWMSGSYTH